MLRKIIGRKEVTQIEKITQEFISDAIANGETPEVARKVAEQVKSAGKYIFNYSHSVSYGLLSYVTGYLKVHYTKEFLCATLNCKSSQELSLPYIQELKRLKIPVLPPDLSKGNREWTIEGNGIRMGLSYLKGVGKVLCTDHTETFESVVSSNSKTVVIPLIKSGALDYLGESRAALLAKFATTQDTLKRIAQCEERIEYYTGIPNKVKLLEQWKEKLSLAQEIQEVTPEKYDTVAGECEVMSFSFSEIPKVKTGVVTRLAKINDKRGREMAFAEFETSYGTFKATIFADGWEKVQDTLTQGNTYKFVVNDKGILEELQVDDKVIKVNKNNFKNFKKNY